MAILKKQGNSPFYKTGPLYAAIDPIDPSKKKAAEAEAKAKAEKSASSSEKIYGKPTTTTERFKDERGRTGTRTTVTTPYSRSGEGSVSYAEAYKKADKSKYRTLEEFTTAAKADRSGKDVKTSVKYDPIKTVSLKPQGVKLTTAGPKAPMPKITSPKKEEPKLDLTSTRGSSTTVRTKKYESRSRKKKAGSGHPCKSCN